MHLSKRMIMALVFSLSLASAALAQEGLVSTMKNVGGVMEDRGYALKPVFEMARIIPGDEAPAQAFEVVRPGDGPVEFGRLFTSCSCIRLETEKKSYGPGERATFTLRNVKPTPHNGQVYQIFVQVTSPVRTTLRYNVFVQSDRFTQGAHIPSASVPVEGQVIASMPATGIVVQSQ